LEQIHAGRHGHPDTGIHFEEGTLMRQLVFIHGRAQQHKDPDGLKLEWIQAWESGLAKSGLEIPIPASSIRFPYFGETLDQLVHGVDEAEAAQVIVRGGALGDQQISDEQRRFMLEYAMELKKKLKAKHGINDDTIRSLVSPDIQERGILNWPWVQGILSALDRDVPMASDISVALFTNDVFQYLTNTAYSSIIDKGVQQAMPSDSESVVVSHSLGTVVAYRILHDQGSGAGWRVPLFVTLGSPLGVEVIRKHLAPIGFPACAKHWFNAMDDRDVVALWPLDKNSFNVNPAIENKTDVDNPSENRHNISGYLGDKEVARRIHDALVAP
jgi:hypothetical protein